MHNKLVFTMKTRPMGSPTYSNFSTKMKSQIAFYSFQIRILLIKNMGFSDFHPIKHNNLKWIDKNKLK